MGSPLCFLNEKPLGPDKHATQLELGVSVRNKKRGTTQFASIKRNCMATGAAMQQIVEAD
jgi:hypothetical protein